MNQNVILLSFDVASLFTMIPINEAVQVIANVTNPKTSQIVKICLRTIFFNFQGDLYEQIYGFSMGSTLSPIVANLFMKCFQHQALNSSPTKFNFWDIFMENTNIKWPHGKDKFKKIVEHMNSQIGNKPHLRYTLVYRKTTLLIKSFIFLLAQEKTKFHKNEVLSSSIIPPLFTSLVPSSRLHESPTSTWIPSHTTMIRT